MSLADPAPLLPRSPRARRAVGLDRAMLDQARALVAERNLVNVEWQLSDVYRLPFAELARVCRSNGSAVRCDRVASPDPTAKRPAGWSGYKRHPGSRSDGVGFRVFWI